MEKISSFEEWIVQNRLDDCPKLQEWYNEYVESWFKAAEPYLANDICPVCCSNLTTRVQTGYVLRGNYEEQQDVYIVECNHCDFSYCD